MDQAFSQPSVIIKKDGSLGRIILNRPKALNALNFEMIREITYALKKWDQDCEIKAIYIDGAGDRAFCAGGDIKKFYNAGMDYRKGNIDLDTAMLFFKEEYELNSLIFNYQKPFIAHMHGITMGGGFGLGGNARYRIITNDIQFAMPEAKIGFFPDVGSMYHLKKMPEMSGLLLALSGMSIKAEDMIFAGLASYRIEKNSLEQIIYNLNQSLLSIHHNEKAHEAVGGVLEEMSSHGKGAMSVLENEVDGMREIFTNTNLQNLIPVLKNKGGILEEAARQMNGNSPISLAIIYAYYQDSTLTAFNDIIGQDFILACNFAKGLDFYEGIRAAVIDKDRLPVWQNKNLQTLENSDIKHYFVK